jgi:hypothetical protein
LDVIHIVSDSHSLCIVSTLFSQSLSYSLHPLTCSLAVDRSS